MEGEGMENTQRESTQERAEAFDILVTNGTVVTMNPQGDIIENGALAVIGEVIDKVGPAASFSGSKAGKIVDARGGVIMPGLINAHTHAAMTCFRGLADDLPLSTWLQEHIFPAESKLTRQIVLQGSLLACAEMILSGTTTFCDMYLFEDAVAEAAATAGMRAVVGEVLYDFPSPNYGPIEKGFEYTRELADRWSAFSLVTIAVEPHSPYLCAPSLLGEALAVAEELDLPMVIHLSETRDEVDQIRERYGCSPVQHLANVGFLTPRLIADHCVILSEQDMGLLAENGVKVAHNPESNMKLASGVAPVPQLLKAGICVALGTDGCASNNNLDMFAEMDTAAKLHKVHAMDPTVLDATTVLDMATRSGAAALGMAETTGSLEPGKKADLIVLDTWKPHLVPMYHPASHIVYSARGRDVVTSIISGQIVMEDRRIRTLDAEKVMADARQIARTIRAE
ncbi:amidohydrolase [Thermodesulfobacteriota bacterium]